MASTSADTHLEINHLRGDMNAALDEMQRRFRGGLRTVASTEARVTSDRTRHDLTLRAKRNPAVVAGVGLVVVGAVGFAAYRTIAGIRERQKPQYRLLRGVDMARAGLFGRVTEVGDLSRRQLEQHQRQLLLKLDRDHAGYMRVSDARLEAVPSKSKERSDVIKKLVWAGLLSVIMAASSVLARRVAGRVWQATVREEPPVQRRSES